MPQLLKCPKCGKYYETLRYTETCPHAYKVPRAKA